MSAGLPTRGKQLPVSQGDTPLRAYHIVSPAVRVSGLEPEGKRLYIPISGSYQTLRNIRVWYELVQSAIGKPLGTVMGTVLRKSRLEGSVSAWRKLSS